MAVVELQFKLLLTTWTSCIPVPGPFLPQLLCHCRPAAFQELPPHQPRQEGNPRGQCASPPGRGRGSSRMANGRLLFLLQCAMTMSQVLCSHHTPAGPTRPHRCSPKWTQTGNEPGNVYRQKGPQQGGGLCNGHRAGGARSPRLRGTSLQQQSPRRQATFAAVPGSLKQGAWT